MPQRTGSHRHAGIPFETEEQLRERGTSKTPDVLLSTPVAVQVKRPAGITTNTQVDADDDGWRIVCWIDSKVRNSISNFRCPS